MISQSARLNADLHCHSTVSDGLLSPTDVVRRAAGNGVELLALTDHDEIGGVAEAAEAAREAGMRFTPGVEISVSMAGQTVHIVGLGVNPEHPALVAGLEEVRSGRDGRAARIAAELEKCGIRGALEGARRHAGNPSLVSRSHFARYLVEIGLMPNPHVVFDYYLAKGKPGYVEHVWASLENAVGWIHAAGGLAVIAHPGRLRLSKAQVDELFAQFRDLGGEGVEVVSGSQDPALTSHFASMARRYGLLASRASDFHGPDESPVDLGRAPMLPPDLTPVWERLI